MKKLLMLASAALLLASCEKENIAPKPLSGGTDGRNLVAELIHNGDPDLYNRIYNHTVRGPKPSIKVIHGIYYYNPNQGAESGTCLPHPTNPCFLVITFPALVDETTPEEVVTSNFSAMFAVNGDGELILNTSPTATHIYNVSSVNCVFSRSIPGQSSFTYTHF